MSATWALVLISVCSAGDGLDDARLMVERGLLRQAQRQLEAVLADEPDSQRRARALLLLGNVDYERGQYSRAIDRYTEAEMAGAIDAAFVAAAQGNRGMAEARVGRGQEIQGFARRLRAGVAATLLLAGGAVTWLARRPRAAQSAQQAIR